jgi:hypothetical protein
MNDLLGIEKLIFLYYDIKIKELENSSVNISYAV